MTTLLCPAYGTVFTTEHSDFGHLEGRPRLAFVRRFRPLVAARQALMQVGGRNTFRWDDPDERARVLASHALCSYCGVHTCLLCWRRHAWCRRMTRRPR